VVDKAKQDKFYGNISQSQIEQLEKDKINFTVKRMFSPDVLSVLLRFFSFWTIIECVVIYFLIKMFYNRIYNPDNLNSANFESCSTIRSDLTMSSIFTPVDRSSKNIPDNERFLFFNPELSKSYNGDANILPILPPPEESQGNFDVNNIDTYIPPSPSFFELLAYVL
jgi:hypothetical protein